MSAKASSEARALPPSNYLALPASRVFAHRGLALEAPENTLLSFANAIAAGAEYIETDVHVSSDGVAVVSHDSDLRRLANRPERLSELSFEQLARIDLGGGQGFCSLTQVLETFPTTRFNIDVKVAAAAPPTAAAVLAAGAVDRVLLTSFSERRRAAAVRAVPGVASSASAPRFLLALVAAKLGFSSVLRFSLRGLVAVQVPERAAGMRVTTARVIRRLQAAGVEVHIWTINDPQRMHELLELGVDGLVTDRADLALEVVASRV